MGVLNLLWFASVSWLALNVISLGGGSIHNPGREAGGTDTRPPEERQTFHAYYVGREKCLSVLAFHATRQRNVFGKSFGKSLVFSHKLIWLRRERAIDFNARDYYPTDGAWDKALTEMAARVVKLHEVKNDFEQIAIHCSDFIKP